MQQKVGSSKEQTFESFFGEKLKEYSIQLIHRKFNVVHEDDAIVIFREDSNGEDKIFIAYLELVDVGVFIPYLINVFH